MRGNHVLSWAAVGIAAAGVAAACFLPAFEVAVEASIGAGSEQRAFRYSRELTLAGDLRPAGLLSLAAGLALIVAAVAGVAWGSRWWIVVASFGLAVALLVLVFDTEDKRLGWPGDVGVIGYEEPNGGPLLQRGIDDLQSTASLSPEAQEQGWSLGDENWYAARGLGGWAIFQWSTIALGWLTTYRLARLRLRPVTAASVVAGTTLVLLVWLLLRALSGLS